MSMAYECIMYPDFYKSLGHDIGSEIEAGTAVLCISTAANRQETKYIRNRSWKLSRA